jgi:heat shock protein HslJ
LAGAIARTRNSCEKNRDLLEQVFLIALHSVPVWRLDNGELIITSKTTTLRFRRGL